MEPRQGNGVNYLPGPDGVLLTEPRISSSYFTENKAKWLFGPRVSLAWDPSGRGNTSIRLGYGIAYNLLDNIGRGTRTALPGVAGFSIRTGATFPIQFAPGAPPPPGILVQRGGGGFQTDMRTPTVHNYRAEIEQGLGANMSLRVAYIGLRGYHGVYRAMMNGRFPVICSTVQGNCPAGLADGTKYFPAGAPFKNPALDTSIQMRSGSTNNYNALHLDLNRRFRGGLAFRTNYSFGKAIDDASSLSSFQARGNPALLMDPDDRRRDNALSAFHVRNRFSFNGSYELPIGAGKPFLAGLTGLADKLLGGWQLNGILSLQGGFPITPLLPGNSSRDGNTTTHDRPDWAPGRTHEGIYLLDPRRWYDPTAFALPVAGTYGNVGRNLIIGPGLAQVDMSLFKTTRFTEKLTMQFRAEVFNLFNRPNFGLPSLVALTSSGAPDASAGLITMTGTTSRQIQFGLKLSW